MTGTEYHPQGADTYCLDYVGKSQKRSLGRAKSHTRYRISRYANELAVATVTSNLEAPRPRPGARGKRKSRNVSPGGRKRIRRSVSGLVAARPMSKCAIVTLTTQKAMPDKEFRRYVDKWLHSARKAAPHAFSHYVIAYELQKRGVLHAHILLFRRIPYGAFLRLRSLWVDKYELGAGGVDVKQEHVDNSRAAAHYLSKLTNYVTKDADEEAREFVGNAYAMSRAMYAYGEPRVAYLSATDARVRRLMAHAPYGNEWSAFFFVDSHVIDELLSAFGLSRLRFDKAVQA